MTPPVLILLNLIANLKQKLCPGEVSHSGFITGWSLRLELNYKKAEAVVSLQKE
jgi:hypothetical protein